MTAKPMPHSTDDLIRSLAGGLRPVPRFAIARRMAEGIALGVAASTVLLLLLIGARPDLQEVLRNPAFWSKVAYAVATTVTALFVSARLSRPGARTSIAWLLAVPFLLYVPFALWELATTPRSLWPLLLLSHGWRHCTARVLALAIPINLGMVWAFKRFAPTDLLTTGAVVGLTSAAVASIVYCLHCPSDAAVFALTWYTLAFAIAALLGSIVDRKLLHW